MKTSMLVLAAFLALTGTALAEGPAPAPAAAPPPASAASAAPAARAAAPAPRPRGYRSARYSGGRGASWKTGRDAYGFMGSYGGCRYRGHAGPNGYRLDKSC